MNVSIKKSLRLGWTTCLTSALVVTAVTAAQADMGIKESIAEGMRTNPEIHADQAAARSAEHVITQAKSDFYPKADLSLGSGYEYTRNKFQDNKLNGASHGALARYRNDPRATVNQLLFSAKTLTDVKKAESETVQAKEKIQETRELVAFRILDSAVLVRRFQRLGRLTEENVREHKSILGKVQELVSGGRSTDADLSQARARLRDAQSAVFDLQGDLGAAEARYIEVVGIAPDRLTRTEIPKEYLPKTVEEAIQIAREKNKSVLLSKSSVGVAQAEYKSAQSAFWPTLGLETEARRDFNVNARDGFTTNLTALVVARYNIFNGLQDVGRKKEIAETIAEQKAREALAVRSAEKEVRISWAEMQSAMKQSEQLRLAVAEKKKTLDSYKAQFDLGTRSLLDILDAINEYFLAKGSLITVDATTDLTAGRLLASMGALLEKYDLSTAGMDQGGMAAPMTPAVAMKDAPTMDGTEDRIETADIGDNYGGGFRGGQGEGQRTSTANVGPSPDSYQPPKTRAEATQQARARFGSHGSGDYGSTQIAEQNFPQPQPYTPGQGGVQPTEVGAYEPYGSASAGGFSGDTGEGSISYTPGEGFEFPADGVSNSEL